MEEVARRHEEPLTYLRDTHAGTVYNSSFSVDQDLLTRIRSLLVARNEQYPPKTPPPSPDYSFSPSNIHDDSASYFPENPGAINFNSFKAIAKLAHAKAREPRMVSTTFDGPAGQLEDPYTDGVRRSPSHPNVHGQRSASLDNTTSNNSSGLNQRLLGDHIGRDYWTPVDSAMTPISHTTTLSQTSPQKACHGTQTPAFVLRTLRPATPQSTEKRLRPGPQHVPGSYVSEVDRSIDTRSVLAAPPGLDYASIPEDGSSLAPQQHYGSHTALPQGAVEALTKTISHDSVSAHRPVQSIHSKPSLRERPSNATLSSRASAKQLHHLLFKPPGDPLTTSMPIEPVLTSDINHMHEHVVPEAPLHFDDGRQSTEHPAESEPEPSKKNQTVDQRNEGPGESIDTIVKLNGPPLFEVLAELPPLRQEAAHESGVYSLNNSPPVDSKRAPVNGSTPRHRSPESFLKLESRGAITPQSPALGEPEATGHLHGRGHDPTAQNGNFSPRSDTEVLSTDSTIISVSSGNSSPSDIRKSHTNKPAKSGRDRNLNETSRLEESPSLRSGGGSLPTNENIDTHGLLREPQLLHEKPYQAQHNAREAQEIQQPKLGEYLLSRLLGRRATPPDARDPTNLTARPYHRQRSMADAARRDLNNPESAPPTRLQNVDNESFNQVICDLETLLQEAILIARQVADQDRTSIAPSSPNGEPHQGAATPEDKQPGKEHIVIVESEEAKKLPRKIKETRDATPYLTGSVVATRHSSVNPGNHTNEPWVAGGEAPQVTLPISQQSPQLRRPNDMPPLQPIYSSSTGTTPSIERIDWATRTGSVRVSNPEAMVSELPVIPRKPSRLQTPTREQLVHVIRESNFLPIILSSDDIRGMSVTAGDHVPLHQRSSIQPRSQSVTFQTTEFPADRATPFPTMNNRPFEEAYGSHAGFLDPSLQTPMDSNTRATGEEHSRPIPLSDMGPSRQDTIMSMHAPELQTRDQEAILEKKDYNLGNRHHFSVREPHGFSLSRSHRRARTARDWSTSRKRFVAAVACINTALLGLIVGIYAGEVPAIQYAIVDEHHYAILGNVVFYAGLAIPTALLWPLPLLYGRKPFILAALALLIPLQFPQALVVGTTRSPYAATYRTGLLVARAISGLVMGFANINFLATLLDLFGASLQSGNPHQEVVNENDVRRHGGGMGVWLGIWTWCFIGSIGVGFLIGALVISGVNVSWGFYIAIVLIAFVLLLNIITPEVRRSPYRRSMAEVRTGSDISRRVARGEVKMHLQSTGPKWWWEEVIAGNVLCLRMLKQPGFLLLALYLGWIYGQVILVIVVSDASFYRKASR